MASRILCLVLGVLGGVVDILANLASVICSWTLCILDPDIIVESGCISEPGDVRECQVSGQFVNLEEVVGKSNCSRLLREEMCRVKRIDVMLCKLQSFFSF